MQEYPQIRRWLDLVTTLDDELAWHIGLAAAREYAGHLARLFPEGAPADDAQGRAIARRFHEDGAIVEALVDPAHARHAEFWDEWRRHAAHILRGTLAGWAVQDEVVTGVDDLTQDAMQDLWCGLRSFRYESRFTTWAYAVLSHCLSRRYRALNARKRAAIVRAISLEALVEVEVTIASEEAAPEAIVEDRLLRRLIDNALAQCGDDRLAAIFRMWAEEDQTLRAIGEQLHLSAARVHGLLGQALDALRAELTQSGWVAPASDVIAERKQDGQRAPRPSRMPQRPVA